MAPRATPSWPVAWRAEDFAGTLRARLEWNSLAVQP